MSIGTSINLYYLFKDKHKTLRMDVIELTQQLVSINSENPPGNEVEVAKFINDYLIGKGIHSELIIFDKTRANVIAEIGKGEGLLFNGHMDTVPIGDSKKWNQEPLSGKVIDNKLYGRGSGDMKGAVAAMIKAAESLNKQKTKKRLVLTFVADEEGGNFSGTKYLLKNKRDFLNNVKYGVVGESTENKIRISQRGFLFLSVDFSGKSSHGSKPELGENAILKAMKFSLEVDKLYQKLKINTHPMFGKSTISLNTIKGGVQINTVPDNCRIELDRRLGYKETVESAMEQFENILKSLRIEGEIKIKNGRNPMLVRENSEIIKMLLDSGSGDPVSGAKFGYTEAEFYSDELGIDCVVCGPGSIGQAHSDNEFVKIELLKQSEQIYTNLMKKWCT